MQIASSSSAPFRRDPEPAFPGSGTDDERASSPVMALPSKARERSGAAMGRWESPRPPPEAVIDYLVDPAAARLGDAAMVSLGAPARHAGERVAVPAERDRLANGVL